MKRINARRYNEFRGNKIKECQYCNWYLKERSSCRVIEPGQEVKVELDEKCTKYEKKRGEERSTNNGLDYYEYTIHI